MALSRIAIFISASAILLTASASTEAATKNAPKLVPKIATCVAILESLRTQHSSRFKSAQSTSEAMSYLEHFRTQILKQSDPALVEQIRAIENEAAKSRADGTIARGDLFWASSIRGTRAVDAFFSNIEARRIDIAKVGFFAATLLALRHLYSAVSLSAIALSAGIGTAGLLNGDLSEARYFIVSGGLFLASGVTRYHRIYENYDRGLKLSASQTAKDWQFVSIQASGMTWELGQAATPPDEGAAHYIDESIQRAHGSIEETAYIDFMGKLLGSRMNNTSLRVDLLSTFDPSADEPVVVVVLRPQN